MEIKVTVKNVYGQDLYYPACKDARTFALIASTKTLGRSDLSLINRLGYDIEVVAEQLDI